MHSKKVLRAVRFVYILQPLPWRIIVLILLMFCLLLCHYTLPCIVPITINQTVYLPNNVEKRDQINTHHTFDPDQKDVLVFLHMQKTGGTIFEKLVCENLIPQTGYPCKCIMDEVTHRVSNGDCKCVNSNGKSWLYTRLTEHWICGVHADWSQLHECVPHYLDKKEGKRDREYHYITMLRDPLKRYLSEWKHVVRGATWGQATISCFEDKNTTSCYSGNDWKGVSLKDFMECPNNNARNRQVMMMASLRKIGCNKLRSVSKDARDRLILESAKENLRNITFFGFMDEYHELQRLSELTLDAQLNDTITYHRKTATTTLEKLSQSDKEAILKLNNLDQQFYQYAKELYHRRFPTS